MKLRLSHCSIRRSLTTVQRFRLCGPGVHSPCYPRHMNPSELAGWPGTHSPCSPRPSRQVISSADGTSWRPIRHLSPILERHTPARGQATDPGPSPELGKADTRSGEGPESVACSSRHLSKFSAEPENLHGARSAHRIWRRVRHKSRRRFRRTGVPPSVIVAVPGRLHAPCGFSGPGENPLRRGPANGRSGTFPRARVCLSKLGERCRIDRLQPARVCFSRLGRSRPTSSVPPNFAANARAADSTAESARAGTPSGRPARGGPSGRCTPRSWA